MLRDRRDPEGTNLARLRAFRVSHGCWKLPGLEDEEGERVGAVFPAKQYIDRSLKPKSDQGWMIIVTLYKKNHRSVNCCGRNENPKKRNEMA